MRSSSQKHGEEPEEQLVQGTRSSSRDEMKCLRSSSSKRRGRPQGDEAYREHLGQKMRLPKKRPISENLT
ncbi:hypothetical protein DEO72_LG10g2132 [Vigna unguiculata]|uniref:Uncharacterized protein n=1 Tax=Vigna unguiculata TaxID=3917 RepID=A0A4D6NAJ9_VIGUN|nr:hypothetical protein DEO72_LG10g2132 [Vigna unguiculata]